MARQNFFFFFLWPAPKKVCPSLVYLIKTENYKSHYRVLLPPFLGSKYSPQHNVLQYPPLTSLGFYKSYH